mmetsp:Transcript_63277/g.184933  ORF Transcript_63277/g.184933 Transcript_63277/m.184933 type:complete len:271 (+) Transcript_63277:2709-3521(+)
MLALIPVAVCLRPAALPKVFHEAPLRGVVQGLRRGLLLAVGVRPVVLHVRDGGGDAGAGAPVQQERYDHHANPALAVVRVDRHDMQRVCLQKVVDVLTNLPQFLELRDSLVRDAKLVVATEERLERVSSLFCDVHKEVFVTMPLVQEASDVGVWVVEQPLVAGPRQGHRDDLRGDVRQVQVEAVLHEAHALPGHLLPKVGKVVCPLARGPHKDPEDPDAPEDGSQRPQQWHWRVQVLQEPDLSYGDGHEKQLQEVQLGAQEDPALEEEAA